MFKKISLILSTIFVLLFFAIPAHGAAVQPNQGGTGLTTTPALGQTIVGNNSSGYGLQPHGTLYGGKMLSATNGLTTSTLGAGSLNIASSSVNRAGLFSIDDSGNTFISGTLQIFGLTKTANLTPITANTYDLGSFPLPWGDLYTSSTANFFGITDDFVTITATGTAHAVQIMRQDPGAVHMTFANQTTGFTTGDGTNFGIQQDGDAFIKQLENGALRFFTNNIDRASISSAGVLSANYGLIANASSSIGAGLQIAGTVNVSSSLFLAGPLTLNQGAGFNQGRFIIDTSGNISTSGTLKVFGATTLAGLTVSSCTGCGGGASSTLLADWNNWGGQNFFASDVTINAPLVVTNTITFGDNLFGNGDNAASSNDMTDNGKYFQADMSSPALTFGRVDNGAFATVGADSVRLGYNAEASSALSYGIGSYAKANGTGAISIGTGGANSGAHSVLVALNSTTTYPAGKTSALENMFTVLGGAAQFGTSTMQRGNVNISPSSTPNPALTIKGINNFASNYLEILDSSNISLFTVSSTGNVAITRGLNATTTLDLGTSGLGDSSKSCINMRTAAGTTSSMYVNGAGTLVVELNACR